MNLKDTVCKAAVFKALKDAVGAEESLARLDLHGAMVDAAEEQGVKSVDATLPDGTKVGPVTLVGGQPKPAITDEPAFLAWVEANHPGEVETVKRVRSSYTAQVLKHGTDANGEVPPGVDFVPSSQYVRISLTQEGREAIARAWRRGELTMVDPYPAQVPEVEAAP